jgi:hypothetical protein
VIAGVALLVTIVAWLFDRFLLRRRRLVYRVQVDTPIGVHPQAHKDKVDVAVSYQDKEIADPSIVLIRIDNPGVDIEPEHFETPLAFEFPDREIAGLEVTRANSDDIVTAVKERLAEAEKLGTSCCPGERDRRRDRVRRPRRHPQARRHHGGRRRRRHARPGEGPGLCWRATA